MKILVVYYSRTGNTEMLARAIAEGVKAEGIECVLKRASDVKREDFLEVDGIIAGSPVYFGSMASELKKVFDEFVDIREEMECKIGAAFATSGDKSGGKETTLLSIIQAMLIYGMIIVGDPMDATGHYGVSCTGRPSSRDLENARKLGKRVANLVKRLRA